MRMNFLYDLYFRLLIFIFPTSFSNKRKIFNRLSLSEETLSRAASAFGFVNFKSC
jgi:hypothetical protein